MEGEAIMICIDTSKWMTGDNSHMYKEQADAIELYCTEKFKSHPETVIGICGMSNVTHFIEPCKDIWQIMRVINERSFGGYLMLVDAVLKAHFVWFGCRDKELGVHLPKRIVMFAGGPLYDELGHVQIIGKWMKDKNVACDAISFGDPARNKHKLFEALIAAADNNGNCNHLHVPPNSSVRDALSSSQIIRSDSAPFASLPVQPKQNINALSSSRIIGSGSAPLASLPVQQESSKQNINAVPRYQYLRRCSAPHASLPGQPKSSKQNINALSSSQIIGSGSAPLASLPVQQESSKQNINAVPRYLRSGSPTYASLLVQPESSKQNINALSSSQIIGSGSAPHASLPVQQESSKQNINAVPRYQYLRRCSAPHASLPGQPESSKQNINALSRSRIIPHVGGSSPLASSVQQESSKLDKKAAANYPESVDPHDYPAKINTFVGLKLENVKPNSQPETFDERSKRVKQ